MSSTASCDRKTDLLLFFLNFFNLKQHNFILNAQNRLLDLVFSNIDCFIAHELDYIFKIDPSHPPLCIEVFMHLSDINVNFPSANSPRLNYRKANYTALVHKLSTIDWPSLLIIYWLCLIQQSHH